MRAPLILVASLLVMAVSQSAAALPFADFDATGFVVDGTADASGGGSLVLESGAGPSSSTVLLGDLRVAASELVVETDQASSEVVVGGVAGAPAQRSTNRAEMNNAVVEGARQGDLAYVYLLGADAMVETSGSGYRAHWTDEVPQQYRWVVSERERLGPDADRSVKATLDDGTLRVTGDFVLAVWDWDMVAEHDQGRETFRSGEERSSIAGRAAERVHSRQVYLFVEDGVAEFTVDDPGTLHIYTEDVQVRSTGAVTYRGSTGTILDTYVVGEDVEVHGTSTSYVRPGVDALQVRVEGEPDRVVLGGVSMPLPEPARLVWPWLLAAALAVTVGAAMHAWNRSRTLARLQDRFREGEYEAVPPLARALRLGRHRHRARLMGAIAELRLGRPDQAERWIRVMQPGSVQEKATQNYLWAYLYALRGQFDQASHHVAETLRLEPAFKAEFRMSPLLRPLLGQERDGAYA